MRHTVSDVSSPAGFSVKVRQLDGVELLQATGFSLKLMAGSDVPEHKVAASLAGNAFSAFALGHVLIGLLMRLGAGQQPLEDDMPFALSQEIST